MRQRVHTTQPRTREDRIIQIKVDISTIPSQDRKFSRLKNKSQRFEDRRFKKPKYKKNYMED